MGNRRKGIDKDHTSPPGQDEELTMFGESQTRSRDTDLHRVIRFLDEQHGVVLEVTLKNSCKRIG